MKILRNFVFINNSIFQYKADPRDKSLINGFALTVPFAAAVIAYGVFNLLVFFQAGMLFTCLGSFVVFAGIYWHDSTMLIPKKMLRLVDWGLVQYLH